MIGDGGFVMVAPQTSVMPSAMHCE